VSRSVPPAAVVVGAVGVLGLGGFAYFGLTGKARESQLDSSCAPRCQQSDADHLRMTYLAADISLGVGVAALGIATWIAVASVSRRAPPTGTWLEVHPLLGGAGAGVVGHFQ
jgi:hypothetical protein